jgi:hypothetical protein
VIVDLDTLSSTDLVHLAHLARQREQGEEQARCERIARASEMLDRPALGCCRRNHKPPPYPADAPPLPKAAKR